MQLFQERQDRRAHFIERRALHAFRVCGVPRRHFLIVDRLHLRRHFPLVERRAIDAPPFGFLIEQDIGDDLVGGRAPCFVGGLGQCDIAEIAGRLL